MSRILNRSKQFLISEDGPTASEYAILLALVIVVGAVAIRGFGGGLLNTFGTVNAAQGEGPGR